MFLLVTVIITLLPLCIKTQYDANVHVKNLVAKIAKNSPDPNSYNPSMYELVADPLEQDVGASYGEQSPIQNIKKPAPKKVSKFSEYKLIPAQRLLRAGLGEFVTESGVFQNAFTPFDNAKNNVKVPPAG